MVWDDVLKRRWKGTMHDVRQDAIEKALNAGVVFDESNYEALIPFGPSWIHQDYWRDMVTKVCNIYELHYIYTLLLYFSN